MSVYDPSEGVMREKDQGDILATALYLSQSNTNLTGMSAVMWVEEAINMRDRVRAIGNVFYLDNLPEELTKP